MYSSTMTHPSCIAPRAWLSFIELDKAVVLVSWWRDLTECGPLEKGLANHFSILALRTP